MILFMTEAASSRKTQPLPTISSLSLADYFYSVLVTTVSDNNALIR